MMKMSKYSCALWLAIAAILVTVAFSVEPIVKGKVTLPAGVGTLQGTSNNPSTLCGKSSALDAKGCGTLDDPNPKGDLKVGDTKISGNLDANPDGKLKVGDTAKITGTIAP